MRKTILLCLLVLGLFTKADAQQGFMPITPENAHLLELGYIIPESFCEFSSDGKLATGQ